MRAHSSTRACSKRPASQFGLLVCIYQLQTLPCMHLTAVTVTGPACRPQSSYSVLDTVACVLLVLPPLQLYSGWAPRQQSCASIIRAPWVRCRRCARGSHATASRNAGRHVAGTATACCRGCPLCTPATFRWTPPASFSPPFVATVGKMVLESSVAALCVAQTSTLLRLVRRRTTTNGDCCIAERDLGGGQRGALSPGDMWPYHCTED